MDAGPISVVAVTGTMAVIAVSWLIAPVLRERHRRKATFAAIAAQVREVQARPNPSITPRPALPSPGEPDGPQPASACDIPQPRQRRRVSGSTVPPKAVEPGTPPRHVRAS